MISQDELRLLKKGKETEQREMAAEMVDEHANQQMAQVEQGHQEADAQFGNAIYQEAEQIAQRMVEMQQQGKDPEALLENLPPEMQQAVIEVVNSGPSAESQGQQSEEIPNIKDDTIPANGEIVVPDDNESIKEAMSFDMSQI